jgi:GDP-L-fucose synthase
MNEAPLSSLPIDTSIFIAGHQGLVGSAIMRRLQQIGYRNIITAPFSTLDLRNQEQTLQFFHTHKPEYVICAAAKVGGILANMQQPASFIYDNLMIGANVIHASYVTSVKKLLFLGSSCIYPKLAPQPLKEESLMTGSLEPSNEPYAVAKIAGITMCQSYNKQYGTNFVSVMPTNLYGPGDTFDEQNSHVIPALIERIYNAHITNTPQIKIWGSGNALREFMHVDDCAHAIIKILHTNSEHKIINIGSGQECSIAELAQLIKKITGYQGSLVFDTSKPDGTPRKLVDCAKLHAIGFKALITLENGLIDTIEWYMSTKNHTETTPQQVQHLL